MAHWAIFTKSSRWRWAGKTATCTSSSLTACDTEGRPPRISISVSKWRTSTRFAFSQLVPEKGRPFRFNYEYDFGDGWEHEVLFEGYPAVEPKTKYPLCLEGARSCPPEDVGGVGGYEDFLEALAEPKHERHEEFIEWGGDFDAEKFDPKKATKAMQS